MEVQKAILKVWTVATYTATIRVIGAHTAHLTGIPVARNIPDAAMVAGRKVAVLFFDETNPKDAIVIAVYT